MSKAPIVLTPTARKLNEARDQLAKANEKREDAISKLGKAQAAVVYLRKLLARRNKAHMLSKQTTGKVRIAPPAKPLTPAAPLQ